MHTHRIDSFLISENVRIEVVHESNPYFAGEPISVVVRFRHLGSQQEFLSLKDSLKELHEEMIENLQAQEEDASVIGEANKPTEKEGWSVKSLLSSFAINKASVEWINKKDIERRQQLRQQTMKLIQFHKPIHLISGYLQIAGFFQFYNQTISESSFEHLGKKKVASDSLSNDKNLGQSIYNDTSDGCEIKGEYNNILRYVNSNYDPVNGGLISKEENQLIGSESSNLIASIAKVGNSTTYKKYPIFLIPQSLLFSELQLEAGQVKTFHFKSDAIPKDLPPSYNNSKLISTNYYLEIGVNRVISANIKQEVVRVPINLGPYVSGKGEQYTATLDREPIIMQEGVIKELKQSIVNRRVSSVSMASVNALTGGKFNQNFDNTEKIAQLKQNFVALIHSNDTALKDTEELVEHQIAKQFENTEEIGDDLETENNIDGDKNYLSKRISSVRGNIANLENTFDYSTHKKELSSITKTSLIPQLVNLQRSYQINRNGIFIAELLLSKPFYTTSDDIDMILSFEDKTPQTHKVSAVTLSLESFELIHPDFDSKDVEKRTKPKGNLIYESHAISFDECTSIPFKLILPKSPSNQVTGQFKTDIFQVKWMLKFKFVLISKGPDTTMEQFYEDSKGYLLHAKETIDGEEFSCHLPLPLLPSSHAYGGW